MSSAFQVGFILLLQRKFQTCTNQVFMDKKKSPFKLGSFEWSSFWKQIYRSFNNLRGSCWSVNRRARAAPGRQWATATVCGGSGKCTFKDKHWMIWPHHGSEKGMQVVPTDLGRKKAAFLDLNLPAQQRPLTLLPGDIVVGRSDECLSPIVDLSVIWEWQLNGVVNNN